MAIRRTAADWPYMDESNYIDETPEYTRQLAAKLDSGEAEAAAAINAAAEAKTARDQAQAIAGQLDEVAALNIAAGSVSVTVPSGFTGGQSIDAVITFPSGRFTAAPAVVATPRVPTNWAYSALIVAVSATSCTLRLVCDRDYTAGGKITASIYWIAVQV